MEEKVHLIPGSFRVLIMWRSSKERFLTMKTVICFSKFNVGIGHFFCSFFFYGSRAAIKCSTVSFHYMLVLCTKIVSIK